MRILGRVSSINVRKVLWAADELGLAYEREDVDTRSPTFRALNPNGLVPVLVDEGGPLWESNTICRYLAAGTPLLPDDPRGRAQVEQWMDWQSTELNNAWRFAFSGLVRKFAGYEDLDRIAASVRDWNRAMGVMEARLVETGAWLAGETFTLADVLAGLAVHRWRWSPIERTDLPRVEAYYRRLLAERPAFAPYARPEEP